MKVKAPLEKEIQKQILAWLRLHGATAIRVNSGAFGGEYKGKKRFIRANDTRGCSDVLCCWRGRFVAIEVKRPGEKPTIDQVAFLQGVQRSGGLAFVASSVDDVENYLNKEVCSGK